MRGHLLLAALLAAAATAAEDGAALYATRCVACHGDQGQGVATLRDIAAWLHQQREND